MASIEEEIREILSTQSYSTNSAAQLEDHLLAQVRGEVPYMGDSVRRLIKLYQLFPNETKHDNVARALLLTVLEYPNNDFLALGYMISPSISSQEPCATVQKCSTLLDACRFPEFWKAYEILTSSEDSELAQLATRSVSKFQKSILDALAQSYKEAPADVVCKALNVDSTDAVAALKHDGVVDSVNASWVSFVPTINNTKTQRVHHESVDFASISSLMAKIAI